MSDVMFGPIIQVCGVGRPLVMTTLTDNVAV